MSSAFVVLMGMGTVFIGLICIVFVCMLMSFLVRKFQKTPAQNKSVSNETGNSSEEIPNREEFVAAVSAALSEYLGKDISGIRILSIKKL